VLPSVTGGPGSDFTRGGGFWLSRAHPAPPQFDNVGKVVTTEFVGALNRGGSYDYFRQSCTGVLAASLEDTWLVAINIAVRAGADPGYAGVEGPPTRRHCSAP
jgi:hypothetical protein